MSTPATDRHFAHHLTKEYRVSARLKSAATWSRPPHLDATSETIRNSGNFARAMQSCAALNISHDMLTGTAPARQHAGYSKSTSIDLGRPA